MKKRKEKLDGIEEDSKGRREREHKSFIVNRPFVGEGSPVKPWREIMIFSLAPLVKRMAEGIR